MIPDVARLRELYSPAKGRAANKVMAQLDRHASAFVERSPFVILATSDADGRSDASPRGGAPGFVRVPDEHRLWLPDAPGNNRLDSLENVLATGRAGLLFLIPGLNETLRVNGRARLLDGPDVREACRDERRVPKLVIELEVEEAFLHCAKALMRSELWSAEARQDRDTFPTIGEILNEQQGRDDPPETRAEMETRYEPDL